MLTLLRFASPLLLAGALSVAPAFAQTFTRSATTFPTVALSVPNASIAFGNGVFVGLGLKGRGPVSTNSISVDTSTDGSVWTERVIDISGASLNNHGVVRFIGGQFIFTGASPSSPSYAARSSDGVSWNVANPANLSPLGGFQEIVTGGDTSVGIFGAILSSSTDGGATWTARTAPGITATAPYSDIAYGAGRFVLVTSGAPTKVWTSTDAASWTEILAGQQNTGRIAHGNGIFVLTGANYKTSTDGVNFTVRPTPAGLNLTGTLPVRFLGGRFITPQFVFNANATTSPILIGSPDGLTWTRIADYTPNFTGFSAFDFAEGNNRLVVVGFQTSGTPLNPQHTAVAAVLDTTNLPPLPTAPAAPTIATQPIAQTVVLGGNVTFSVTAAGTGNSYQWRKDATVLANGANIAGATTAMLTLNGLSAASAGNYSVVITNSVGSTTSASAALTVVSASAAGRLINLSILTALGAAGDSFTMGYVVGGASAGSPKSILVRAAGPSLSQLGVQGFLADPKLETFAGSTPTGENDNWGGNATLGAAMASVGAFAYSGSASLDAAALSSITGRDNSVKVSATGSGAGTVIAEVYDATPAASFTATTPRLINVSVLKNLGSGLTAGFVIGGSTPKAVLIRAVGPTLASAPFNVPGTVADPQLTLFAGQTSIGSNDNWGGTPALATTFAQVGAFALPAAARDAALVTAPLAPGDYTVQVSGVGNTSGTALVEVYEIP